MFSNQAGLAIENAMLYRNLEEVHQTLKETQTFLVHQEKMAALGELSATIAHEIRNPSGLHWWICTPSLSGHTGRSSGKAIYSNHYDRGVTTREDSQRPPQLHPG